LLWWFFFFSYHTWNYIFVAYSSYCCLLHEDAVTMRTALLKGSLTCSKAGACLVLLNISISSQLRLQSPNVSGGFIPLGLNKFYKLGNNLNNINCASIYIYIYIYIYNLNQCIALFSYFQMLSVAI
jgi:hypothetical protein